MDYECSDGFVRINSESVCVRDQSSVTVDPFAIPETCKSGSFYSRTRGYKKIENRACINEALAYSPELIPCPFNMTGDFLIVAERDKISRINLADGVRDFFPLKNLKRAYSIDYDVASNCLLWGDSETRQIMRQCWDGKTPPEVLLQTRLHSYALLTYDWISKMIYYVEATTKNIEAFKVTANPLSRPRRTMVESRNSSKFWGLAVHPMKGLLFFTDWNWANPTVCRVNLDGSDRRVLLNRTDVKDPSGITIDFEGDRIYWVDTYDNSISSADFDGKDFKKIVRMGSFQSSLFITTVHKVSHQFLFAAEHPYHVFYSQTCTGATHSELRCTKHQRAME